MTKGLETLAKNEGIEKNLESPEFAKVKGLFEQCEKEMRYLRNFSEHTLKGCRGVFNRWLKYVKETPTQQNLSGFVIWMREAGLNATTCNISITAINSFLTRLKEKNSVDFRRQSQRFNGGSNKMLNYTAKMPVLRFLVLYLGITSATFGHIAESSQAYTQKADDIYDNLTVQDIKDILGNWDKNQNKINGSDDADNQIPAGTVIVYVTSDKNYGKLKILKYGYNLTVGWTTYSPDGSVISNAGKLLIMGTCTYDLDYGSQGKMGMSKVDFWWEQVDQKIRYLVPQNGAMFALVGRFDVGEQK